MKITKWILTGLSISGFGLLIVSGCAPLAEDQKAMELDQASDNYIRYNGVLSEYGRCNTTFDVDGDGLVDMQDPDCHLNAGPLRDLSLYDFPLGHNFDPDVSKISAGSPGAPGGFRDRAQIARWFRFLTEADGAVAGTKVFGPGVNPSVVPVPAPLNPKIRQGTYAQGNNNNVDESNLHLIFLEHGKIPANMKSNAGVNATFNTNGFKTSSDSLGAYPGGFYKGGSQGYLMESATGNPDDSNNSPR